MVAKRKKVANDKKCTIVTCDNKHYAKGYCFNCYRKFVIRKKKVYRTDVDGKTRISEKRGKPLESEGVVKYTKGGQLMVLPERKESYWSEEIGDRLVELVEEAKTYTEICKVVGVPVDLLCKWKNSDSSYYKKEFAEKFKEAYKNSADVYEHNSLMIARDISNDMYEDIGKFGSVMRPNNVSVQRARLQIDVNNRMAAVRNREKFAKLDAPGKFEGGSTEQNFIITYYGEKPKEKKEQIIKVPINVVGTNRISGDLEINNNGDNSSS